MRRALLFAFVLAACSKEPSTSAPSACAGSDAIVAVSDYTSSEVGSLALDGGAVMTPGFDLGTDPVLSVSRGRAFYMTRKESRLFELDACGRATSEMVVSLPSFTGSVNPQDVAAAPDGALWVPLFATPVLAIVQG